MAGTDQWQKVLLTEGLSFGAKCLDGSPGGFYFRPSPTKSQKWVVFHQGGGWCLSPENCLERASTNFGSSVNWGPTYTDRYEGSAMFATPPFTEFNLVYAMYCDGGSWAGNSSQLVKGKTIYYRGRALLDALLDKLLSMG